MLLNTFPAAAPCARACTCVWLALLLLFASPWARAADEVPRFDILEFAVQGNTLLDTPSIERAIYPFMGERRTLDDVEAARAALEKAYRDAGWGTVSVDIPEQQVTQGVVELRVLQGEVSRLRVTGARWYSQGWILAQVPALAEGQVPNLKELQAQMLGVNRNGDRRVAPVLRPGREPGTTEVDLAVEDRLPLHANAELNNKAGPNTSATRLLAGLRYDNLFQADHSLALQWQLSPEKTREVRLFSASYTVPFGLDQVAFSYLRSDSEVAAGSGDTTVFGKGQVFGVRRTVVLALADKAYHALSVGADFKDFKETVDAGTGAGFSTPLRYLPLNAGYTGSLEDEHGRWQLGAGLTVGLRRLATQESQFADKRFGATSGYSLIKLDGAREEKLPLNLSVFLRVDLQYSGQPLVSNEQITAGGADTVRGYLESAATGDFGVRSSLELRGPLWSRSKDSAWWRWLASAQAFAFVDGASLEIHQPLPAQFSRTRLLGTGLGLRLRLAPTGSLSLTAANALKTVGTTQRGDWRLHASGAVEF